MKLVLVVNTTHLVMLVSFYYAKVPCAHHLVFKEDFMEEVGQGLPRRWHWFPIWF